jgi:heme oxygenase
MNELSVSKEDQDVFLNSLRTKTAKSHTKLEENELSRTILSSDVTVEGYQAYLSKMYGVIAGCENDVFPALTSVFPDLKLREKSEFIIRDLQLTGMPLAEIEQLPVCEFRFSNVGEALGIMYVLEGSTLGGKVLYKHIHKVLGLDELTGASFFWGYGTDTGNMWKNFIHALSEYAITRDAEQDVISSAAQTFNIIDEWLSR